MLVTPIALFQPLPKGEFKLEQRRSERIPVSLAGFLQYNTEEIPIQVVNISAGGACLSMKTDDFARLEKADTLAGYVQHRRGTVPFDGQVCWTSTVDDITQTGISFVASQPQLTSLLLEFQPQKEEEPREGSFFI